MFQQFFQHSKEDTAITCGRKLSVNNSVINLPITYWILKKSRIHTMTGLWNDIFFFINDSRWHKSFLLASLLYLTLLPRCFNGVIKKKKKRQENNNMWNIITCFYFLSQINLFFANQNTELPAKCKYLSSSDDVASSHHH